jgi:hypothetical protein
MDDFLAVYLFIFVIIHIFFGYLAYKQSSLWTYVFFFVLSFFNISFTGSNPAFSIGQYLDCHMTLKFSIDILFVAIVLGIIFGNTSIRTGSIIYLVSYLLLGLFGFFFATLLLC